MEYTTKEIDNIRLDVGIHTGYRQIERDNGQGLVGSKRYGDPLRPLPRLRREINKAALVFKHLSSPLLHDLNSMTIMLNAWEDHLHPVPNQALRELVETMESYILAHGGHA
jgi:hypothetical protein